MQTTKAKRKRQFKAHQTSDDDAKSRLSLALSNTSTPPTSCRRTGTNLNVAVGAIARTLEVPPILFAVELPKEPYQPVVPTGTLVPSRFLCKSD